MKTETPQEKADRLWKVYYAAFDAAAIAYAAAFDAAAIADTTIAKSQGRIK